MPDEDEDKDDDDEEEEEEAFRPLAYNLVLGKVSLSLLTVM